MKAGRNIHSPSSQTISAFPFTSPPFWAAVWGQDGKCHRNTRFFKFSSIPGLTGNMHPMEQPPFGDLVTCSLPQISAFIAWLCISFGQKSINMQVMVSQCISFWSAFDNLFPLTHVIKFLLSPGTGKQRRILWGGGNLEMICHCHTSDVLSPCPFTLDVLFYSLSNLKKYTEDKKQTVLKKNHVSHIMPPFRITCKFSLK